MGLGVPNFWIQHDTAILLVDYTCVLIGQCLYGRGRFIVSRPNNPLQCQRQVTVSNIDPEEVVDGLGEIEEW